MGEKVHIFSFADFGDSVQCTESICVPSKLFSYLFPFLFFSYLFPFHIFCSKKLFLPLTLSFYLNAVFILISLPIHNAFLFFNHDPPNSKYHLITKVCSKCSR